MPNEDVIQSRLFLTASTGSTSAQNTVEAYFDSAADRDAARELLGRVSHCIRSTASAVDWLELYQQSLQAALHRLALRRRARSLAAAARTRDRLTIVVPQEQAFGTGSHETTCALHRDAGVVGSVRTRADSTSVRAAESSPWPCTVSAREGDRLRQRHRRLRRTARQPHPQRCARERDAAVHRRRRALRGGTFDVMTMNIIPEVIVPLLGDIAARLDDWRSTWRTSDPQRHPHRQAR